VCQRWYSKDGKTLSIKDIDEFVRMLLKVSSWATCNARLDELCVQDIETQHLSLDGIDKYNVVAFPIRWPQRTAGFGQVLTCRVQSTRHAQDHRDHVAAYH